MFIWKRNWIYKLPQRIASKVLSFSNLCKIAFKNIGGCLGTSYDEDEGPYLPGPSSKKGLRSRTSSKSDSDIHTENTDVAEKLKLSHETSNTRDQKKLFGKCKPGGCLDPPFGEDKEPYRPPSPQAHKKPVSKVKDSKQDQKISASTIEVEKSSKTPTKSFKKESNKDVIEPKPLLDIYARPVSSKLSSTSNYSNATIRHPSKMSSSKMLDAGKKNSKTYDDDSLRQSFQYPETYFIPPKDMLQHKEEERRYSRERSNDQIRPTTTRRENAHQTSNIPDIIDESNKMYPEYVDAKCPQSTKLSKQKGKDNTERIKQTLTDLTSYEIDNASKTSEDYRENSKIPLNVPLVAQKVDITSSYKETPSANVTYHKKLDDFDIPITSDDLDLSIISKCDQDQSNKPEETYSKEHHENVTQIKNKETTEVNLREKPITDKLYEPENKYQSKDMRNKNVLKSDEPSESEKIITAKPELGKLEDFNIISTSMIGQREDNILQLVPSSDTQKSPKTDRFTYDLHDPFGDQLTKTSDIMKEATDLQLSPNISKNQTKLLMTLGLQSLENVLDVDVTSEKNNTTPEAQFNYYEEHEIKDTSLYPDTTKYGDDIQNVPSRETFQEQTNESQDSIDKKPINEDLNPLVGEVDADKINKSITTGDIRKQQMTTPDVLVSKAKDNKINKNVRTEIISQNQINGNKNIQEEQMQNSQMNHKIGTNIVQSDTFNDVPAVKNDERKSLEDLDFKIIHSEKNDNLDVEVHDKTTEEKLGDLKLRDTPSNHVQVKNELQRDTDLISNQNQIQNTPSSKTFHQHVLDEQYRKTNKNEDMYIVPNDMAKTEVETFINVPSKINKHIENIPNMKNVVLDNEEDFNTEEIRKPNNKTNISSENLEKNVKQVQDKTYKKNNETDSEITSVENAFDTDSKKQLLTSSPVDSDHIKRQPIDANIINYKKSFKQNSSHDNILDTDTEFSPSSSNSTETNDLNYYNNEKAPLNLNRTDNDVIIKNTTLHDRNKNITLDTQDTTLSDILHKPPLVRAEDADLRNDDINVIKPFKRNTFTIVASSTSLEKQEETISIQQTNHTANEQLNAKKYKKNTSSDQTTDESESFTQNNQQNNNDFIVDSEQETIKTESFLNTSTHSGTRLQIDRSRESYSETANPNKYPGPSENQKADSIKIMSNTVSDDKFRTYNYDKSNPNYINVVDNEIPRSQDLTYNKSYNKEKLILKSIPDDMIKHIAELQDKSHNDFEHLQTEPRKIYNNEKMAGSVLNENFSDTAADNAIKQIVHSQSREYTDDLSNGKISILNISEVKAEGVSLAEHTSDIEKRAHEEKVAIASDVKLDINYAHNAMEYESKSIEISEGEHSHELRELKTNPDNSSQSLVGGEPIEYISKPLSDESYRKIDYENAKLDPQSIQTKDQSATIVHSNYSNSVENVNKVVDKNSIMPEYYRPYVKNETSTGNLEKISDSEMMGSFNKSIDKNSLDLKDDTNFYSEYVQDTKTDGDGDLKNVLELFSVESLKKNIDTTSIVSKGGTKYYSEFNSPIKNSENGDLRKMTEQVSVGNINKAIDEKPLMAKYDVAHNIEHDTISKTYLDEASDQQFADAMENLNKAIDEKLFASKDGIGYSNESAPLSKAPIPLDSTVIEQELGVEKKERVYNQNENSLSITDLNEIISNPVHKTNSEVLLLNLTLQSYVNDNNHTVVQTVSPLVEPVRYTDDNITVVQSLIRHGHEIRIPVDVENDLSLKFTTKTHQIPQNFNADQNSPKKGRITRNLSEHAHHHPENINKSLAFIYERELIPLHNVIKNLTEEINILTTQQELLKDKVRGAKRTKSLRLVPVNKRCGCGRM
ncbi:uncharacterized protein isoform X2 [Choristoneura fumiferana]|uniref:uncharacterized protein isoform X2 n=1 Tax=Choristoneura fumiferana TaxID=7141 RepID=UPI003D1597E5